MLEKINVAAIAINYITEITNAMKLMLLGVNAYEYGMIQLNLTPSLPILH